MRKLYSLLLALMLLMSMCAMTACGDADDIVDDDGQAGIEDVTEDVTGDIGEDAILKIILDRVPGATEDNIVELERDYDDGYMQYEGSLIYDGVEYEFEIDAETGNILDWEID